MISLNDITAGYQSANLLNTNFQTIENYFNNNVLDVDGSNAMQGDINLNGYDLLNAKSILFVDDLIMGEFISVQATAPAEWRPRHVWLDTDTSLLTLYSETEGAFTVKVDLSTHSAADLTYDETSGNLAATNTEAAINEVQTNLETHEGDTANPHNVTAAQAGALAVDGSSTMTGDLDMDGNSVKNDAAVVYTASSGAFDRANGEIQEYTMTADETFTISMLSGQSLTLIIYGTDTYTPTWPSWTWKGSGAPTGAAEVIVEVLKVGSTVRAWDAT